MREYVDENFWVLLPSFVFYLLALVVYPKRARQFLESLHRPVPTKMFIQFSEKIADIGTSWYAKLVLVLIIAGLLVVKFWR